MRDRQFLPVHVAARLRRTSLESPTGITHLTTAAALVGAATLVVEISLTRLFSVLLFYHYVFLVLAIAFLGLGLGGVLAALLPDRRARANQYAAGAASIAALTTVITAVLSARVLPPNAPLLHAGLAMLPFLCAGLALPLLLAARPDASGRIYAADLAGAACGTLLAFALLFLGAITATLGGAVLYALAAWMVGRPAREGRGGRLLLLGLVSLLFIVNAVASPFDVDLGRLTAGKPLAQWLTRGQASLMRTSWDPFARVDVVHTPSNPLERLVFVDGAAGSTLPHYPTDANEETKRRMELGAFPYGLVDAERALVIGSGGGLGVLYALLDGVDDVTAVEVSPGVVDAVRAMGEYNGFLYDRPEVNVVTEEGRSFLRRDTGRYDVIDLSLVVSLATAQSGYALTENYLFTEEAFASVYQHLSDDGIAAIRLYDDPTLTRAFLTAAAAVRRYESSDAAAVQHLAVVFNPKEAAQAGPAFYPMLFLSKRPLNEEAAKEFTSRANNLGYTVMFAPFTQEQGPFGMVARGDSSLTGIESQLAGGVMTPTTDARPFFFEMSPGLPRQLVNTWIAVAIVAVVALAGVLWLARAPGASSAPLRALVPNLAFFAVIGVAFMLVELALLPRLGLFLGHPTISVVVVLGMLLLAGGAGSFVSSRSGVDRLGRVIVLAAVAVAGLGVLVPMTVDNAFGPFIDLPLGGRIAASLAVVAPLGFAMGMLFPSGLRLTPGDATLPWAVNGVASVVGAVLATTLALEIGYPAVSLVGAALYGCLALVGPALLGQPFPWLGSRQFTTSRRPVSADPGFGLHE